MKTSDNSQKSKTSADSTGLSRRRFLASSGAAGLAGAASTLAFPNVTFGEPDNRKLKVGLIGCGGRGTGAANQALDGDSNSVLYALADAFPEPIEVALKGLHTQKGERVDVPPSRQFTGIDAYQQMLDTDVDVVLLATPPGFRPLHYKACVEAGKNVFAEKPVAVDAPGVRSVMETTEKAKEKGIYVLSGLCWRYDTGMRETVKRIQDGAIGDIINVESTRYSVRTNQKPRLDYMTDMQFQLYNWYYYTWLSGDFICEQFVHELDKISWLLDEYPTSVTSSGGRISRTAPEFGQIYDHFNSIFEYESGRRYFAGTRQQLVSDSVFRDIVNGTEGKADLMRYIIEGKELWRRREPRTVMHQLEHDYMYEKMRKGEYFNNGDYMAKSTLMGIMARESAYTGKTITWDEMLKSDKRHGPDPEKITVDDVPPAPIVVRPGDYEIG